MPLTRCGGGVTTATIDPGGMRATSTAVEIGSFGMGFSFSEEVLVLVSNVTGPFGKVG